MSLLIILTYSTLLIDTAIKSEHPQGFDIRIKGMIYLSVNYSTLKDGASNSVS
jgi:hypothetical protein